MRRACDGAGHLLVTVLFNVYATSRCTAASAEDAGALSESQRD
jgi:hypothetical protein